MGEARCLCLNCLCQRLRSRSVMLKLIRKLKVMRRQLAIRLQLVERPLRQQVDRHKSGQMHAVRMNLAGMSANQSRLRAKQWSSEMPPIKQPPLHQHPPAHL